MIGLAGPLVVGFGKYYFFLEIICIAGSCGSFLESKMCLRYIFDLLHSHEGSHTDFSKLWIVCSLFACAVLNFPGFPCWAVPW